ncbi:uncharacterized protein MEPE_01590 [Melanopsichium pennsylvanicum]|uniref:Early transcribed membrane protein n=1 Tax=Melanopsichium pennsylvanicum TaxID=63383 RepID=A0AAJ4XHV8_9BASI|nr:uncharacterized protein MEPE_01590 [Melanopsichium pennsylvanicum]
MRFTSASSLFHILLHLSSWLLAAQAAPLPIAIATEEHLTDKLVNKDTIFKFSRSFSNTKVSLKKAPEKLKLGENDFLGSGLKRKSVAGAYAATGAVGIGGVAVIYQAMNLRSKERDADKKQARDEQVRQAVCLALRSRQAAQTPTEIETLPSTIPPLESEVSHAYPSAPRRMETAASSATGLNSAEWGKRALSDATLNTIEDYAKVIGATEAIVSGGIAMKAA